MRNFVLIQGGALEAEYFLPTEAAQAAQFAQEHGLALYSLVVNGGLYLDKQPPPETELLGFAVMLDHGLSLELSDWDRPPHLAS